MTNQDNSTDKTPPTSPPTGLEDASPADLKVNMAAQTLRIQWQDGQSSEFSLSQLRRVCPCATCRTERDKKQENPLQILKTDPTSWRVTNAQLVGHYAIQFIWSDGHNAGIYDFRMLRKLSIDTPGPA